MADQFNIPPGTVPMIDTDGNAVYVPQERQQEMLGKQYKAATYMYDPSDKEGNTVFVPHDRLAEAVHKGYKVGPASQKNLGQDTMYSEIGKQFSGLGNVDAWLGQVGLDKATREAKAQYMKEHPFKSAWEDFKGQLPELVGGPGTGVVTSMIRSAAHGGTQMGQGLAEGDSGKTAMGAVTAAAGFDPFAAPAIDQMNQLRAQGKEDQANAAGITNLALLAVGGRMGRKAAASPADSMAASKESLASLMDTKANKVDVHELADNAHAPLRNEASRLGIKTSQFKGREGGKLGIDIADKAIDSHRDEFSSIAQPFLNQRVNMRPMADAMRAEITAEMRNDAPEVAQAIGKEADALDRTGTLQEVNDFISRTNKEQKAYYNKNETGKIMSEAHVDAQIQASNAARQLLQDTIGNRAGVDPAYLRQILNTERDLIDVRNSLSKEYNSASKAQAIATAPKSWKEQLAGIKGVPDIRDIKHGLIQKVFGVKPIDALNYRLKSIFSDLDPYQGFVRPPAPGMTPGTSPQQLSLPPGQYPQGPSGIGQLLQQLQQGRQPALPPGQYDMPQGVIGQQKLLPASTTQDITLHQPPIDVPGQLLQAAKTSGRDVKTGRFKQAFTTSPATPQEEQVIHQFPGVLQRALAGERGASAQTGHAIIEDLRRAFKETAPRETPKEKLPPRGFQGERPQETGASIANQAERVPEGMPLSQAAWSRLTPEAKATWMGWLRQSRLKNMLNEKANLPPNPAESMILKAAQQRQAGATAGAEQMPFESTGTPEQNRMIDTAASMGAPTSTGELSRPISSPSDVIANERDIEMLMNKFSISHDSARDLAQTNLGRELLKRGSVKEAPKKKLGSAFGAEVAAKMSPQNTPAAAQNILEQTAQKMFGKTPKELTTKEMSQVLMQSAREQSVAKVGGARIFSSPNVSENTMSIGDAEAATKTAEHKDFVSFGKTVGYKYNLPVTANPAVGNWTDGAENSVHMHIPRPEGMSDAEFLDKVRAMGAEMGKRGNQKYVSVFSEKEGGPDHLHVIRVPQGKLSVQQVADILDSHGVKDRTIHNENGHTVVSFIDKGKKLDAQIDGAAKALGASEYETYEGTGEFNGAETREQAGKVFDGQIRGASQWSNKALQEGAGSGSVGGKQETAQQVDVSKTLGAKPKGFRAGKPTAEGGFASLDIPGTIAGGVKKLAKTFFSKAEQVAEDKLPNKIASSAVIPTLKNAGVSAEQMKWLGLDDFLDGKNMVSKQELLDHIRQNDVQITEKMLGGLSPSERAQLEALDKKLILHGQLTGDDHGLYNSLLERGSFPRSTGTDTKYHNSSLQTPGGKEYRELLLTMPEREAPLNRGDRVQWDRLTEAIKQQRAILDDPNLAWNDPRADRAEKELQGLYATRDRLKPAKKSDVNFIGGHYGDVATNVLAHIRFNDRFIPDKNGPTGPYEAGDNLERGYKDLHLEEVQSDWHQKGRREGYTGDKTKETEAAYSAYLAAQESMNKFMDEHGIGHTRGTKWSEVPQDVKDEYSRLADARDAAHSKWDSLRMARGVPDAPFKTTWHELALKRMLRYAAENGYDRMSWTTGDTQNQRYDLSKHVDEIHYSKEPDGTYNISGKRNGQNIGAIERLSMPASELAGYVGKEVADKIIRGEGEKQPLKDWQSEYRNSPRATEAFQGETGSWYLRHADGSVTGTWPSKESAERDMLRTNRDRDQPLDDYQTRVLRGSDLKIGGSGMKGFYDKIIPDFLNKYGKKWGAKVGESVMNTANMNEREVRQQTAEGLYGKDYDMLDQEDQETVDKEVEKILKGFKTPVHHIDITPEMKKDVLEKGQPISERKYPASIPPKIRQMMGESA